MAEKEEKESSGVSVTEKSDQNTDYSENLKRQEENSGSTSKPTELNTEEDRKAKIHFECESCGMKEMCHYHGKSPPFANGVRLLEDSFVMRDPFQPPPPRFKDSKAEYFIIIGSNCYICNKVVCRGGECSFFYMHTFCIKCAKDNVKTFPLESQTKLHKQIANNN